jgi:hypothetical protein
VVWSHPIAPVGSHPLPTMPVSGQPRDAALLSHIVVAYLHVLHVMMTSFVLMSCRRLDNA